MTFRRPTGRPGGRPRIGGATANSLLQAATCCASASEAWRKADATHDEALRLYAMDQAILARRFLDEIIDDKEEPTYENET